MILDIKKTILRQNISSFIATIVFLILIVVLLFVPFRKDLIKGVSNNLLALFAAMAYVLNALFRGFRNVNYIYYNDESDKIVLRYFSPNLFTTKKNSIEIPKREVVGYHLTGFFMGYRENLIIHRKTQKGTATYPPVSITALTMQEKHDLLISLEKLKQQNSEKLKTVKN